MTCDQPVAGATGRTAGDEYEFDVCLSFAGIRRPYVVMVAERLVELGIRVFYDYYEEVDLWGKDLYVHLDEVYRLRSRYCVLFVSEEYATQVWTSHERRSAQARAFTSNSEYILPARFDDTELPGLVGTIGYVDLRRHSPAELAELVAGKLSRTPSTSAGRSAPVRDTPDLAAAARYSPLAPSTTSPPERPAPGSARADRRTRNASTWDDDPP